MLQHDLRHALRWLRANRGFTLAAVLVLSMSIAITTATFSVVYGVVLRPLPFPEPDRIVRIWSNQLERNLAFFSVSPPDFVEWRARSRTLTQFGAYEGARTMVVSGGAQHEVVEASRVTAEILPLLGVTPALGRLLTPEETGPGGPRVALISHGLWQRRFGGRSDVLGQTLVVDDEPWTIVGVTPQGFSMPNNAAEVWLPMQASLESAGRSNRYLRVLARLRPGQTYDDARIELTRIAEDLGQRFPATNRAWGISMRPFTETVVGPTIQGALLVLLGAVILVLLLACANVAGLLLSRAATRQREMAVRTALGARRWALIRQMLVESLLLATLSGFTGLILAMWCADALKRLAADTIPRIDEVALRPPVLIAAIAAIVLTAIAFGLVPALTVTRNALASLRTRAAQQRSESRSRDALVLAEIAIAVVLLIGAGLLTRSFVSLQNQPLGFSADRIMLVDLVVPERPLATENRVGTYDALVSRVAALPGVESAAGISAAPFAGRNSGNFFTIVGRPVIPGDAPDTDFRVVTAGYLRTMQIPIVRGRDLTDADGPSSRAVVISAAAARRYWPDADPIGADIQFGKLTLTIVGIAADARYGSLDAPNDQIRPMMYLPHRLMPDTPMMVALRTAGRPETVAAALRPAVAAAAPRMPISRVTLMDDLLAEELGPPQFNATVLGAFAWIALVLAAAGLWGLIAYGVARRTREIGIRIALGATPSDVMRLTAGRGLLLAIIGVAIGLIVASSLAGLMERLLFRVSPTDRTTFVAIAAVFLAVAGAASVLPARRALRIDPAEALRLE